MTENDQPYEITAGQVLVLEPGKQHWGHRPTEEETDLYWVHFIHDSPVRTLTDEEIDWTSGLRKGTDSDVIASKQVMYLPKYAQLDLNPLIPILDKMCDLHHQFILENALQIHSLLAQLFDQLQISIRNRNASRSLIICDDVVRYLHKYRCEPFHAIQMANELHFHQDYLTRCFKKHTGMTPHQYLQSIRLEEAKVLLVSTSLPVERIAEKVGIPSCNYFIRLFRLTVGMPPGVYRKSKRGYV